MSAPHDHHEPHATYEPWIDRWWPLLLIAFGLIFTLCLTLYRPQHEWSRVQPAPATRAYQLAPSPPS